MPNLDRQGSLAGTTGSRCRVFYQDGSNNYEIPGVGSVDFAPSTRAASTFAAFEGSFGVTGSLEIGAVTFEIASFLPNHRAWKYLDAQFNSNNNVQLRVETNANNVFNSGAATAAISDANKDTGLVTFAPTNAVELMGDVARGHQMVIGTNRLTIEAISDETVPKFYVSPPGSAITAGTFTVQTPILRWLITGKLSSHGGASIAEDAANSSQFIIQPSGRVPLPTAEATHTMGIQ